MSKDQLILQENYRISSDGSLFPAELRMHNHLILHYPDRVDDILEQNNLKPIVDFKWEGGRAYLVMFVRPDTLDVFEKVIAIIAGESKGRKKADDTIEAERNAIRNSESGRIVAMFNRVNEIIGREE